MSLRWKGRHRKLKIAKPENHTALYSNKLNQEGTFHYCWKLSGSSVRCPPMPAPEYWKNNQCIRGKQEEQNGKCISGIKLEVFHNNLQDIFISGRIICHAAESWKPSFSKIFHWTPQIPYFEFHHYHSFICYNCYTKLKNHNENQELYARGNC